MTIMRPQKQREAEDVLALAKTLVDQRGESLNIHGHKRLRLDHLTIIAYYSDASSTLSISSNGETVLFACWYDGDNLPPLFVDYRPCAWRWILRRACNADQT